MRMNVRSIPRTNIRSDLPRRTKARVRGVDTPMRRPNAQLQVDRRAEILAAAERCFAQSGFHGASMQEICAEAGMSPGNLYRYFPSKDSIILGIVERDRAEVTQQLAEAPFSADFFGTLEGLARFHLVERSAEEVALCSEIM